MEEASGCWPRPLSNRAENSSVTPHITPHLAIYASTKKFLPPSNLYLPPPPPSLPLPFSYLFTRSSRTSWFRSSIYTTLLTLLPIESFRLSGALRKKNHVFGFFSFSFFFFRSEIARKRNSRCTMESFWMEIERFSSFLSNVQCSFVESSSIFLFLSSFFRNIVLYNSSRLIF